MRGKGRTPAGYSPGSLWSDLRARPARGGLAAGGPPSLAGDRAYSSSS